MDAKPVSAVEALTISCILLSSWIIRTCDLRSWRWFAVRESDDWETYLRAKRFFAPALTDLPVTWRHLADGHGIHGLIPNLNSWWNAFLMLNIFGTDALGWKQMVAAQTLLSVLIFALVARTWWGATTGLIVCLLLACSWYLIAWDHAGYGSTEALLPTGLALLCVTLARCWRWIWLALAGIAAGLGWYTYHSARLVIVLALILICFQPGNLRRFAHWMLVPFVAVVTPLFAVNGWEVFSRMILQSNLGQAQHYHREATWSVWRNLVAFVHNPDARHYVVGPLADPVTVCAALTGIGFCLWKWRDWRNQFLLFWLGLAFLAAGAFSPHAYVADARLWFVLPPLAFLAALALLRLPWWSTTALLAVACVWNLHHWFITVPPRLPFSAAAHAYRAINEPRCRQAPLQPIIVGTKPQLWDLGLAAQPATEHAEWVQAAAPDPCRCVVRFVGDRMEVVYPTEECS